MTDTLKHCEAKGYCTFGWAKRTGATSAQSWLMKEMRRYKLHATNAACITTMKFPPWPCCTKLGILHKNTTVKTSYHQLKQISPMSNWNAAIKNRSRESTQSLRIPALCLLKPQACMWSNQGSASESSLLERTPAVTESPLSDLMTNKQRKDFMTIYMCYNYQVPWRIEPLVPRVYPLQLFKHLKWGIMHLLQLRVAWCHSTEGVQQPCCT
jgi:hypothetical protein